MMMSVFLLLKVERRFLVSIFLARDAWFVGVLNPKRFGIPSFLGAAVPFLSSWSQISF